MLRLLVSRLILPSLVFLAGAGSLSAQDHPQTKVPAEKAAGAKRLIELTGAPEVILATFRANLPAQKAAMPQIPAEFWDEFEKRLIADIDRFVEMIIPIYDRHFTTEQLNELIAFYETPIGRHTVQVLPRIAEESAAAGQQWGVVLATEVARDLAARGIVVQE